FPLKMMDVLLQRWFLLQYCATNCPLSPTLSRCNLLHYPFHSRRNSVSQARLEGKGEKQVMCGGYEIIIARMFEMCGSHFQTKWTKKAPIPIHKGRCLIRGSVCKRTRH